MTADLARAVAYHRSGRLRQAERACTRILSSDPAYAEALHLLGLIAAENGQPALGAGFISQAIQIRGPVADWCVHLGAILEHQHNLPGAAACFRQALGSNGRDADTAFRLGNLLTRCGQFDEAAARYRQAAELRPSFVEAWFNLGVVYSMQSRVAEAVAGYRRAIELQPAYAEAHNNLAILFQASGRFDEARSSYELALSSRPDYAEARYNLALLQQHEGRLDEAEGAYRLVIAARPEHVEAHNNLGNVLLAANRPLEARESYRRTLAIDSAHSEAHWNLGFVDLLLGNFADGWRGYEWRFRQSQPARRHSRYPLWQGEPLNGHRLLIWAEQGLGDTIQMIRFVDKVKAVGGTVIIECQRPLIRLLAAMPGIDQVVMRGDALPPFDVQLPAMSLPGIFGIDLTQLPANVPYLAVTSDSSASWKSRLSSWVGPRIGLAWAGNPKHQNDRNRSLDPDLLQPLLNLPATFFTLQPDAIAPAGVVSLAEHLSDFTETAGLIQSLDLVISVDTSVAHLAGALGRPVWTLLPHAPDWRWMLDREDSPWYPSMRLFRQASRGDWAGVIDQVCQALSAGQINQHG